MHMFPKLKNSYSFLISILLISTLLYSTMAIRTCSAAETPTMLVDPAQAIFTGAPVGTQFQLNVTIANITNLVGLEFKLSWNATLLSCVSFTENLFATVTPEAEQDNIWVIKKVTNNTGGYIQYATTFQDLDRAASGGYAPINITAPAYLDGKLAVAILTFNITKAPPTNTFYESTLEISGIKAGDRFANPISVTIVNGYYKIYGPPETINHTVTYHGTDYVITTETNGTVVPGSMAYVPDFKVTFNITGGDGSNAYVNVTVPKSLVSIQSPADQWNVTVNGAQVTPITAQNATHWFLYITASLSTKTITVIGTIPEFATLMLIPLLMAVTLIAVGIRRRRQI